MAAHIDGRWRHATTNNQPENKMGIERGGGANKDNRDGECEAEVPADKRGGGVVRLERRK